jgi:hypothetical protein
MASASMRFVTVLALAWTLAAGAEAAVGTVDWCAANLTVSAGGGGTTGSGAADPPCHGWWELDQAYLATDAVSRIAGRPWWATGGTSVAIGAGAASGWGEAHADPAAGTVRVRSGAFNYGGPYSNCETWFGTFPPPTEWGESTAQGSVHQFVTVAAPGPGPVPITASFDLEGTLQAADFRTTGVRGALLLTKVLDADAYFGTPAAPVWQPSDFGRIDDILGTWGDYQTYYDAVAPGTAEHLGLVLFGQTEGPAPGFVVTDYPVDESQTVGADVEPGDMILMELIVSAWATIGNPGMLDADIRYLWAEFDQTATAGLTSTDPQVTFVPTQIPTIPEPATLALVAAGAALLLRRRRR